MCGKTITSATLETRPLESCSIGVPELHLAYTLLILLTVYQVHIEYTMMWGIELENGRTVKNMPEQ